MGRKCSHCGNIGHNSRTCTNFRPISTTTTTTTFVGGSSLRLFGVQFDLNNNNNITNSSTTSSSNSSSFISMKKSFSMDCLHSSPSNSSLSSRINTNIALDEISHIDNKASIGYLSDGLIGRAQERKKGVPWSEEEHRTFLIGLEKLGKGDWRGISRNYVTTRTPTQVASHAQKYFLRQSSLNKKKRRSSLFDMVGMNNCNNKEMGGNIIVRPNKEDLPIIPNCFQPKLQSLAISDDSDYQDNHNNNNDQSVWLQGLVEDPSTTSQLLSSNNSSVPDLELKLSGPTRPSSNLEQTKPSQGRLFVGPITVT